MDRTQIAKFDASDYIYSTAECGMHTAKIEFCTSPDPTTKPKFLITIMHIPYDPDTRVQVRFFTYDPEKEQIEPPPSSIIFNEYNWERFKQRIIATSNDYLSNVLKL